MGSGLPALSPASLPCERGADLWHSATAAPLGRRIASRHLSGRAASAAGWPGCLGRTIANLVEPLAGCPAGWRSYSSFSQPPFSPLLTFPHPYCFSPSWVPSFLHSFLFLLP